MVGLLDTKKTTPGMRLFENMSIIKKADSITEWVYMIRLRLRITI